MKRTGNPFVDMGLCAIAALTEKESIGELETGDMKKAFYSYDIVSANDMVKSFTMVFTRNTILGQQSYKKHRKEMYRDLLEVFLENMEKQKVTLYAKYAEMSITLILIMCGTTLLLNMDINQKKLRY